MEFFIFLINVCWTISFSSPHEICITGKKLRFVYILFIHFLLLSHHYFSCSTLEVIPLFPISIFWSRRLPVTSSSSPTITSTKPHFVAIVLYSRVGKAGSVTTELCIFKDYSWNKYEHNITPQPSNTVECVQHYTIKLWLRNASLFHWDRRRHSWRQTMQVSCMMTFTVTLKETVLERKCHSSDVTL